MKAGVLADDHLIEVNGENVENASREEVVEKVTKSGSRIMFLLVDKETARRHSEQKIQFKRETASLKLLPHQPQVVVIKKGSNGYGFYLRAGPEQKGQIIKEEPGSPAEAAGLKNNDLVVVVNGESVEALDHDGVVEMIRKGRLLCWCWTKRQTTSIAWLVSLLFFTAKVKNCLMVLSRKPQLLSLLLWRPQPQITTVDVDADADMGDHKPKLCKLIKEEDSYGFQLNAIRGQPGSFVKEVQQGGPADKAGLENEDVTIETNGENVEDKPYNSVLKRIKSRREHVTLLVCGKMAYSYFQAKKFPNVSSMADPPGDWA